MKKANSIRITNPTRFFGFIATVFAILTLAIFLVYSVMSAQARYTENQNKLFFVKKEIFAYLGEEMSAEEIYESRIKYHDSEDWQKYYSIKATLSYDGKIVTIPSCFYEEIEAATNPEISFIEFQEMMMI